MSYYYAITNIKKQILKKKFLLEELCNSMKTKDKWISVGLYLLSLLTGAVSGIDYAFPDSQLQLISSVFSVCTIVLLKLKSYLNYDYIKELCKKQLVKYDLLFQKIERGITKHSYDQTDEEEFVLCLYRELNVLENNDPEISNSIYDKFIEVCKKMNIPFNDTINQLAELYHNTEKTHKPNKSFGSDHAKIDLQKLSAQPPVELQEIKIDKNLPKSEPQVVETHQEPTEHEPISHVDDYPPSDTSMRTRRVADVFGDLDYGQKAVFSPGSKSKNWTLGRLKDLQD